jgi:hypothetical protein
MTEADWLVWSEPRPLLEFLQAQAGGRKLCLLACGCCRRFWSALPDSHREALDVAERYSDGLASESERLEALEALGVQIHRSYVEIPGDFMTDAVALCLVDAVPLLVRAGDPRMIGESSSDIGRRSRLAIECCRCAFMVATYASQRAYDASHGALRRGWKRVVMAVTRQFDPVFFDSPGRFVCKEEHAHQAALVRDVFGNPFRPATFDSAWRTSTAVAIASQMYESRGFGALPILADALQDAGCDSDDVLNHCRDASGIHVRGCWVVDLVLGKS